MTTIDDRQAIEDLVREFLDTAARGEFPARFWTGPVAELFALDDEVAQSTPFPVPVLRGSARIRKLEIKSIEGDSASVDLRAEILSTLDHPIFGERRITQRYHGGVVLRRESNDWRILTLEQNGVDLASALFDPIPAEATVDGVHLAASARFTQSGLHVLVAIRNLGDSVALLGRVLAGGRVWWLFEEGALLRKRPLVLRSGASWGFALSMKASPLRRPVSVRIRVNERDIVLGLRPPPLSVTRRVRQSLHVNAVLHVLASLSLLAIPLTGPDGVALFALLLLDAGALNVCSEALGFLGDTRISAQLLYGSVGLVELVVAGILLHHEQIDPIVIITSLVLVAPFVWAQLRGLTLRRRAELAEPIRDRAPQSPSP